MKKDEVISLTLFGIAGILIILTITFSLVGNNLNIKQFIPKINLPNPNRQEKEKNQYDQSVEQIINNDILSEHQKKIELNLLKYDEMVAKDYKDVKWIVDYSDVILTCRLIRGNSSGHTDYLLVLMPKEERKITFKIWVDDVVIIEENTYEYSIMSGFSLDQSYYNKKATIEFYDENTGDLLYSTKVTL